MVVYQIRGPNNEFVTHSDKESFAILTPQKPLKFNKNEKNKNNPQVILHERNENIWLF